MSIEDLIDPALFEATNPSRRAATPEVKAAAVTAVRQLLEQTTMSTHAATELVAEHIGKSGNSVRRWCEVAQVGRETALSPLRREYEAQLQVMAELSRSLASPKEDF